MIHDPARGVRRLTLAEVSRHFTGVALELRPAAGFRDARARASAARCASCSGRVRGLQRSLAQIFVLALALEVFALLAPFFLQWVVDGVLVSADRDLLVTLGARLRAAGAGAGGRPARALVGGAVPVDDAEPAVAGQRLRAPDAAAGRLVREAPHRRRLVALRRRSSTIQQSADDAASSRRCSTACWCVATLAMMCIYSVHAGRRSRCWRVALYALLRWAFFRPLRDATEEAIVHDAQQHEPLPRVAARRAGDQAVQPPGTTAASRFMNLVVDAMNADMRDAQAVDLRSAALHTLRVRRWSASR